MNSDPKPVALKCPQCGANLPPVSEGYIICQYCGSSLVWQPAQAAQGNPAAGMDAAGASPAGSLIRGLRMKMIRCTDQQGTGLDVFRMLVPVGWKSQGGCCWGLDNPGMPATINFQAWNTRGGEAFEVLPNMIFTWSNNPFTSGMSPKGSRYFGAEVQQPVSIREAMRRFVLPRYRSAYQEMEILREEVIPELPMLVKSEAASSGNLAEGGKVRIAYTWQNWRFEEEIFGLVEVFRTRIPSMLGYSEFITWFIDYLFACRALAGKLDASEHLFRGMLGSLQMNPAWNEAHKRISHTLIQQQIQRIHNIGRIGEIVAQTGREIREQNLQDWYSRQAVEDRVAVERSRQIRDMEGFYDPHREEVVELPAGYDHAWANNLGEYILTDDPNFNPNINSTLHWEPMPQHPG